MAYVYERPNSPFLYVRWRDAAGKHQKPTEFRKDVPEQVKAADEWVAVLNRKLEQQKKAAAAIGKLTCANYLGQWEKDRSAAGKWNVETEVRRLRKYAMPHLGGVLVDQVRRPDVVACFRAIMKAGQLAPRSIRNAYGSLHRMFQDAIADGLITANPCTLEVSRGELPEKVDKNPLWRATAVFSRTEIEGLISDERIPPARRVLYGLMFVGGGLRAGELSDRRFGDIDHAAEPLPRLTVGTSWHSKKQIQKSTKTRRVRYVPVHPTLGRLIAQWRLSGWAAEYGRAPTDADLIVPSRPYGTKGLRPRHSTKIWEQLQRDCALLGFRGRRTHDIRRTFTSLAQVDGASRDVVRLITHGPEGDVVADYTTLPWPTMCEAVAKLKVQVRAGKLVALPVAVGSGVTPGATVAKESEKAPKFSDLEAPSEMPRAGFENARTSIAGHHPTADSEGLRESAAHSRTSNPAQCDPEVPQESDPGGYLRLAGRRGVKVVRGGAA